MTTSISTTTPKIRRIGGLWLASTMTIGEFQYRSDVRNIAKRHKVSLPWHVAEDEDARQNEMHHNNIILLPHYLISYPIDLMLKAKLHSSERNLNLARI